VSALTASTKQITVTATGGGLTKTLLQTVTLYSR
jgi:hypothetical protein